MSGKLSGQSGIFAMHYLELVCDPVVNCGISAQFTSMLGSQVSLFVLSGSFLGNCPTYLLESQCLLC